MISRYRSIIGLAAAQHALDPQLVEAVVWQESGDDPFAFRLEPAFFKRYIRDNAEAKAKEFGPLAACSYGLMQIMLETAYEESWDGAPEDLFDPAHGLSAGCAHLARLLIWAEGDHAKALGAYNASQKAADVEALAAFNAGQGNWQSPAAQAYAASVLRWKERLT